MTARMLVSILALAACDDRQAFHSPDPSWERMMEQPKVLPYAEPMRRPPPGTVTFGAAIRDDDLETGGAVGAEVATIPLPLGAAELERGRAAFDVYCAACHGVLGDGNSAVAPHMALVKPTSLGEERVRAYPPGRLFRVVSEGYGLMPSYRAALGVDARWEVVAYVKALELSQHARTSDLEAEDVAALDRSAP